MIATELVTSVMFVNARAAIADARAAVVEEESRKRMSPSVTYSSARAAMRSFASRLTDARSWNVPNAVGAASVRGKNATPPRTRSRWPAATSSATSRWMVAELTLNFCIRWASVQRFLALT